VTSFFGIKSAFFSKTTRRIYVKFFSGFRRKHLFITTCFEKQCTRSLSWWVYAKCRSGLIDQNSTVVLCEHQQLYFLRYLLKIWHHHCQLHHQVGFGRWHFHSFGFVFRLRFRSHKIPPTLLSLSVLEKLSLLITIGPK